MVRQMFFPWFSCGKLRMELLSGPNRDTLLTIECRLWH